MQRGDGAPVKQERTLEGRMHWADRPLWVRVGLFGVPSRRAAMIWMVGSLVASMALIVAILAMMPVMVTVMGTGGTILAMCALFAAPLWYWLAIRWTDEHEGWALHTWKS